MTDKEHVEILKKKYFENMMELRNIKDKKAKLMNMPLLMAIKCLINDRRLWKSRVCTHPCKDDQFDNPIQN